VEDNPLFAEQIRNAVAQMRERKMVPGECQEPMLHTWAAQVAWDRLRREAVARAVWQWVINAQDGDGGDVYDLVRSMHELNAPCPTDLNTETKEN
jgi:hypothetical protein